MTIRESDLYRGAQFHLNQQGHLVLSRRLSRTRMENFPVGSVVQCEADHLDSDQEFFCHVVPTDPNGQRDDNYFKLADVDLYAPAATQNPENTTMPTPNLILVPAKASELLQAKVDALTAAYSAADLLLAQEETGRDTYTQRYADRLRTLADRIADGTYEIKYGGAFEKDGGPELPADIRAPRDADTITALRARLTSDRDAALAPFLLEIATIGAAAGDSVELDDAKFKALLSTSVPKLSY